MPQNGTLGDKSDDAHLATADRAQHGNHIVDARDQHPPKNVRLTFGPIWLGGLGQAGSADGVYRETAALTAYHLFGLKTLNQTAPN